MKDDKALEAIWAARREISRECDDDPRKLVQHYIERQKENADKLRKSSKRSTLQSN